MPQDRGKEGTIEVTPVTSAVSRITPTGENTVNRPDVTLQPSKGVVTQAAAQIYAGYLIGGFVGKTEEPDKWIKRSIREAIGMARTIDVSVQSDKELPDAGEAKIADRLDDTLDESIAADIDATDDTAAG